MVVGKIITKLIQSMPSWEVTKYYGRVCFFQLKCMKYRVQTSEAWFNFKCKFMPDSLRDEAENQEEQPEEQSKQLEQQKLPSDKSQKIQQQQQQALPYYQLKQPKRAKSGTKETRVLPYGTERQLIQQQQQQETCSAKESKPEQQDCERPKRTHDVNCAWKGCNSQRKTECQKAECKPSRARSKKKSSSPTPEADNRRQKKVQRTLATASPKTPFFSRTIRDIVIFIVIKIVAF